MARRLSVLLFFFISTLAWAQFDPQFSQNMFNHLTNNPGFAGTSGMVNLSAISRQQWMGFEGAPKTTVFGADAAVKLFKLQSGVGLVIGNDQIGPFKNLFVDFSYAYRIDVLEGTLGIGLNIGFLNQTLDGTTLDPLGGVDGNTYHSKDDPAIPQSEVSGMAFDMGLGAFYDHTSLS